MVVSTLKIATGQLKVPVDAARKLPINIQESARGKVLGRAASIQDFIIIHLLLNWSK